MIRFVPGIAFALTLSAVAAAQQIRATGGGGKEFEGWRNPALWKSDGMWTITRQKEGLKFLKNKKPAHNSMCWMVLPRPLKKGDSLEITYRMERPYKHVDLFLGKHCAQPSYGSPLRDFAEILSLGGIPDTDWQTRRLVISSKAVMNTLGLLCWGWPVDRGTWMLVSNLKHLSAPEEPTWHVWTVGRPLNEKQIPERSPLQDFFPFGVYLSIGDCNRAAQREGKGFWTWMDEVLADLKKRGMNFTSTVNFGEANLGRLVELHRKHGLRMNPQVGQFDIKHNPYARALEGLRRAAAVYRDSGVVAGWAAGEEFPPRLVPRLGLAHDLIHAVDARNTLVTIHNKTEAFELIGKTADVRIAFRDIYPFFGRPTAGPTHFEASMNYYEDEIDKSQRLLPRGASLWVMPQAQGEYHGPGRFDFRTPTPVQIKLEAWSAVAHGAQGLAYFVYHSKPGPEVGTLAFDGLRALDGSPTDRLDALTELAGQFVPLGPLICRWQRCCVPAATDRRPLRAYLFTDTHGRGYAVVYNRTIEGHTSGRVRVPFELGAHVADFVHPRKIPVQRQEGGSVFSVDLPPGEGTIISLGVTVPASISY